MQDAATPLQSTDASTVEDQADALAVTDSLESSSTDATVPDSSPVSNGDTGSVLGDAASPPDLDGGPGFADGACTDLSSDANCGACGYACVGGRHCVSGRCSPAWLQMTDVNSPAARTTPGAAVGGRLIIAGGYVTCSGALGTAAAYDPVTDVWTALPSLVTARSQHTVVSSGVSAFAFGGLTDCLNGSTLVATLERWTPGDSAWTTVTAPNAPTGRYNHESIWTGSALLVYGGASASGALFDPVLNVWSDASCTLQGCVRYGASVIVDQGFIRLWGGGNGGTVTSGLSYQIATGAWSAWTPPSGFPMGLSNPADDGRRVYLPSGGGKLNLDVVIYDRSTQSTTTDTSISPANLSPAGSIAWTGSELVLWSGAGMGGPTTAGGRYQPAAPPP